MRHIPYTLLVLAATAGFASAQATAYTIPVGYVTETLAQSQYNLIGLTMLATPVAQGVIDADTSAIVGPPAVLGTVTDTQVDFGTLLTVGKTYILEITSGAGEGTIQEITTWTGSSLDTPDDISSIVDATTTYTLRAARTVADVFGSANSAGLTSTAAFDSGEADLLLLPKPDGTFTSVYYSNFPDVPELQGWFDLDTQPAGDLPLVYVDGLFVQRRAGLPIDLVVSGEVKKTSTKVAVVNSYTYLGGVYPVGGTLGNSGLGAVVTRTDAFDSGVADLILLTKADGTYTTCYYSTFPDVPELQGWFDLDTQPAGDYPVTSGFIIQRRGPAFNATISAPPGYSSL